MKNLSSKGVKITRVGLMSGGKWQIKITGIEDRDLYDTEVAVLSLFGMSKKEQK